MHHFSFFRLLLLLFFVFLLLFFINFIYKLFRFLYEQVKMEAFENVEKCVRCCRFRLRFR